MQPHAVEVRKARTGPPDKLRSRAAARSPWVGLIARRRCMSHPASSCALSSPYLALNLHWEVLCCCVPSALLHVAFMEAAPLRPHKSAAGTLQWSERSEPLLIPTIHSVHAARLLPGTPSPICICGMCFACGCVVIFSLRVLVGLLLTGASCFPGPTHLVPGRECRYLGTGCVNTNSSSPVSAACSLA